VTTTIESRLPVPRQNAIVTGLGKVRRLLGALLDAMDESRQRQAERTIARYAALHGNRMTDEREMMRRL
jgi:hypothetical protein